MIMETLVKKSEISSNLIIGDLGKLFLVFISVILGFACMFLGQYFLWEHNFNTILTIGSYIITIPLGIGIIAFAVSKIEFS
jgi:hypothetical protein